LHGGASGSRRKHLLSPFLEGRCARPIYSVWPGGSKGRRCALQQRRPVPRFFHLSCTSRPPEIAATRLAPSIRSTSRSTNMEAIDPTGALVLLAALGCALMAGLFFAFSVAVMRALGALPAAQGIAAMQSINAVIL